MCSLGKSDHINLALFRKSKAYVRHESCGLTAVEDILMVRNI